MAKFYLGNPEIDETIKTIRRKIRLLKNGEVAESMREKGLHYKINWGASLLHLKEIASELEPNHDLAIRLWDFKHRETMILATMLEPIESFDKKQFDKWLIDINNIELVEQINMNLLAKHPEKLKWSIKLIQTDQLWHQIIGFSLITRISREISIEETEVLTDRAVILGKTDEYFLYRAIATALSRICRNGKNHIEMIKNKTSKLCDAETISTQFICNEIENEISFLED